MPDRLSRDQPTEWQRALVVARLIGWHSRGSAVYDGDTPLLCSPRLWLGVATSAELADAAVAELRERYPTDGDQRKQWDILGPRFATVSLADLPVVDQIRIPSAIERLRAGVDDSEWAKLPEPNSYRWWIHCCNRHRGPHS